VSMSIPGADTGHLGVGLLQRIDARDYHHCHNMPRRMRCHRKDPLPVNWPPNSDTPGSASLRDAHAKHAACRHPRRRQVR
jgi:hypothetical protein